MAVPMVIDDVKIEALRKYAEEHPLKVDEVRRIIDGAAPPVGDRIGYDLGIAVGYRLVFSIEECPKRDGTGTVWLRRMSMSTGRPGKLPHPAGVEMIAGKLGFPPLKECQLDTDNDVIMVAAELRSEAC